MAEFSSPASLTPDGDSPLLFNQWVSATGYSYQLAITNLEGLDAPVDRVTVEDAPLTDGFSIYPILDGGFRFTVEGIILIRGAASESVHVGGRNAVEKLLRDALADSRDIDNPSTWAWTPTGLTAHSLAVLNEVGVRFRGGLNKTFLFGLVSEASTISVA